MNPKTLQEELLGDGALTCLIEGNEIIYPFMGTGEV